MSLTGPAGAGIVGLTDKKKNPCHAQGYFRGISDMSAESSYCTLTVAVTAQSAHTLEPYIAALTASRKAKNRFIEFGAGASGGRPPESLEDRIRNFAKWRPLNLMVVQWTEDAGVMSRLGKLAKDLNVDVLYIRNQPDRIIRRILMVTGGGTHSIEGLRISSELASAWKVPIEVLRIVRDSDSLRAQEPIMEEYLRQVWELTRFQLRMMELTTPITLRIASSVVGEIVCNSRQDDLVVLGGPNTWRLEQHLAGSIPYDVAQSLSCPMLMVCAGKRGHVALHEVFWEETIRMNLKPDDKWDAIAQLVDTLVTEQQVPAELREQIVEAAWERERILPTSPGYGTAIPHAAIPQFKGIVGSLGICPDGVDFGQPGQPPVHFIYLLLTPKENYSEYLVVLSRIARMMYRAELRKSIIDCNTPAEVAALIDTESRRDDMKLDETTPEL